MKYYFFKRPINYRQISQKCKEETTPQMTKKKELISNQKPAQGTI